MKIETVEVLNSFDINNVVVDSSEQFHVFETAPNSVASCSDSEDGDVTTCSLVTPPEVK